MLRIIILVVIIAGLFALFLKVAMDGFQSGTGVSTNMFLGTSQNLMTQNQKKAMEIVIKKELNEKEEEQKSGEPEQDNEETVTS